MNEMLTAAAGQPTMVTAVTAAAAEANLVASTTADHF